ncbi:MAG TPA: Rieske 2Fe-2S domain-containing protein [Phototrophicaceae bacterium]|nr:Rieske 2Fe-2S domain-containing protein [Phototrophicaceae bacterium]
MATASVTKATASPPAQTTPAAEVAFPNRREFLYYIWGASILLITGQAAAGLIWFALPRFREGEFGGTFTYAGDQIAEMLPPPGAAPVSIPAGRFHLANPESEGFLALYGVCTHLGCLPKWTPTTHRFECPCHGSKYELNGKYIEGPAPRSLDRFRTTLTFADGTTATTNDAGDPIPLDGKQVVSIAVNTGARIKRSGRD